MFPWSAARPHTAICRKCWCRSRQGTSALPDWTTAKPTSVSKPNSPPAPIPTAATSPSSKAATSSAPTAWCHLLAAKSAAAPPNRFWRKPGRWPISATPKSNCWARIVNSYKDPSGKMTFAELLAAVGADSRNQAGAVHHFSSPRFRRDIIEAIERSRRFAITFTCRSRAVRPECWTPCSGFTAASNIWNALPGSRRRSAKSALPATSSSAFRARPRRSFEETLSLLDEVEFDAIFGFKYSPRPNTPSLQSARRDSRRRKSPPAAVLLDSSAKSRRESYQRHVGQDT